MPMSIRILSAVCGLLVLAGPSGVRSKGQDVPPAAELVEVKNWALRFGKDIKDGSTEATCLRKITENYNENMGAKAQWVDSYKLLEEMRTDVQNMFKWKEQAVQRIALEAEKLASNHTQDKHLQFKYINAKKLYDPRTEAPPNKPGLVAMPMELSLHPNFENVKVNTYHSAIHVPVNVYDAGSEVVNDIKWSEGLTQVFRNNLAFDPSLSWQFFGSNTGFLRIWPAAKWRVPLFVKRENITPAEQAKDLADAIDLYDARMRNWFIQAAASPKDMVILLDGSGSMTGQRKEIAKNVVINILDTLGDDDYFTVLRFTDTTERLVDCFEDDLVPANKQNIREFRERLDGLNTSEVANFTEALTRAFDTLKHYYDLKNGSMCNQAIMLVTDGAPDNFQPIFEKYNWPRIPVRVFTYLVGREVTEIKEVNWMACHNRGYYTHVANLAEVREQVQKYIPVMSRPLVLSGKRPFIWTPVYAEVTEVPLTNWVWDERQRQKIRSSIRAKIAERAQREANVDQFYLPEATGGKNGVDEDGKPIDGDEDEEDDDFDEDEDIDKDEADYESMIEKNQSLLASKQVARLAFTSTKVKRSSSSKQAPPPPKVTDKNSPAGTPQPGFNGVNGLPPVTAEIDPQQPKVPRKKTVHLMTTVATPVFDTKNSTNITVRVLIKNVWVEQQREIRTANLLGVAGIDVPIKEIVKLTPAYKLGVNGYSFATTNNGFLLYHPDLRPIFQDMLKPFYTSIDLSEVELADNGLGPREPDPSVTELRNNMIDRVVGTKKFDAKMHLDGLKRVITRTNNYYYGPIEGTPFSLGISLPEPYGHYRVEGQIEVKRRDENYTQYFKGKNWRVHPDWVYCDNPSNTLSGIPFRTPEEAIHDFLAQAMKNAANVRWRTSSVRPHVYETLSCEKDLVQSLVFDAKATNIDPKKCGPPKTPSKYEREITKTYGITLTFVATRSGLTRFEDHRTEEEKANLTATTDRPFSETHVRATDELYYKRAVDYHKVNSSAFVFSVPFDAASREQIYVTASQAVFIGSGKQKAPAAVVGLQYKHAMFAERFFNHTKKCGTKECRIKCDDETTECFLLDNNGYIIVAEDLRFTGKFFGEFDEQLFDALVSRGIYKKTHMYDYQAVCIDTFQVSGPASYLLTPFDMLRKALMWLWAKVTVAMVDIYLNGLTISWYPVIASDEDYSGGEYGSPTEPNDTPRVINKTRPRPCDKEFDLYELNPEPAIGEEAPYTGTHSKCILSGCDQTYIAHPVPYTNLLTLVVLNTCTCEGSSRRGEATPIDYGGIYCPVRERYRRRPTSCINHHPEEMNIKICGRAASTGPSLLLSLASITYCLSRYLRILAN